VPSGYGDGITVTRCEAYENSPDGHGERGKQHPNFARLQQLLNGWGISQQPPMVEKFARNPETKNSS
jgi:hypothetical protein